MSSHGDATQRDEDLPPGRVYTPSDRTVDWSIRAKQREARWLRRARPRPFGFAPGTAHPMPERIGEARGETTMLRLFASTLGLPTRPSPVLRMSIIYRDTADPAAPAAEVTSAFYRDYQHIWDLETELRDAVLKWAEQAEAPEAFDPSGPFARTLRAAARDDRTVPVTKARVDVVVSGCRQSVSMLGLGDCGAFQIREEGVLVTVVARHMGPESPEIVRLTDLEAMIAARSHIDRDAIVATLSKAPAYGAELRRRLRQAERDLDTEADPE